MALATIKNVFKPYKQEAMLAQDDLHTTGLGLTIVENLTKPFKQKEMLSVIEWVLNE